MKILADTFDNMHAVPARIEFDDHLSNHDMLESNLKLTKLSFEGVECAVRSYNILHIFVLSL